LHNRIASRLIFSVLDARGWSESKLAKESGVARSVLSSHLSGARRIRPNHLVKYMLVLGHQERPRLLAAWLRDNMHQELVHDLLNVAGDDLGLDVREYVPTLDDENKRMLAWWEREMARDSELGELFKLLSARAGYRPRRKPGAATPRRHPRQKLSAFMALLMPLFHAAPIEHQAQMAALAVPAILAASETTKPDESDDEEDAFAFVDWQTYRESADVPEQQRTKRAPTHRRAHHSRQQHRANLIQRLADKTVNPELHRLRRVMRRVASR
jgi:hypothetical protein